MFNSSTDSLVGKYFHYSQGSLCFLFVKGRIPLQQVPQEVKSMEVIESEKKKKKNQLKSSFHGSTYEPREIDGLEGSDLPSGESFAATTLNEESQFEEERNASASKEANKF